MARSSCISPTTRNSAACWDRAGCCAGLTRPDLLIAAGFSYAVVSAHNGCCLQMEVTVHGEMAHALPETGVDALQGAVRILNALYAQNARYREVRSQVPGITHPT